jgi:hypothetical protein
MRTIKSADELRHLANLRATDLIAKTAKVTIKDTLRVLIAARAVCRFLGLSFDKIADRQHSPDRPSSDNVAACEQAYAELEAADPAAIKRVAQYK